MTKQNSQSSARSRHGCILAALAVILAFAGTWCDLFRLCWGSDLYSYILLIPFVSAYLAGLEKPKLSPAGRPAFAAFGVLLTCGLLALAASRFISGPDDVLSLRVLAFVFFFAAVSAWFLGWTGLKVMRFPLGFLIFMVPIPTAVRSEIETFLQYGSAAAANGLFTLSGVPVLQSGLSFRLPGGVKFQVEPECSGIHSSVVLLITSLVAVHLLLRTWWKQALLVASVVPLALLRNGFRIYVLGQLCVHYGVRMFDSWVHHHGGPLFFAISLIPFFGLLLWLIKSERGGLRPTPNAHAIKLP